MAVAAHALHGTTEGPEDARLPDQLASASAAVSRLIAGGLAGRRADEADLVAAYEAALLVNFSPTEARTLRRLLARLEAAALRLAARGP